MNPQSIQQVRRFNRLVAERIGALDDRFLQTSRPMNESRLLWEIGAAGEELRVLRDRLAIDSGYLTRVLQALEHQGLVKVRTSPADRRVRCATLTRAGLRERQKLDQRSDDLAIGILETLTGRQQRTLLSAMEQVEGLLQASMVHFEPADPRQVDAEWCFGRYFAELNARFENGFNPAQSISAEAHELVPPQGLLLVARLRGEAVGCGALKFHGKQFAEVKRMWIVERLRGLGIARRLLRALEGCAAKSGVRQLRLETNRALPEAIALYKSDGFSEVKAFNTEPYAHHWFQKPVARHRASLARTRR